jgi:hypothetical protein
MNNSMEFGDKFIQCVDSAIGSLRQTQSCESFDLIVKAMCMNPDAPQPHNLLGIWYELNMDGDKARRHYRAAYSLDPAYKPSCKNLERICTLYDHSKPRSIDYGDEPEEISAAKTNNAQSTTQTKLSHKVNRRTACI